MSRLRTTMSTDEALAILAPKGETPEETEPESIGEELAKATELLLSLVPKSIATYARELADITLKVPRWQLLLGSFMAQYDSGMLPQPHLEPGWRRDETMNEAEIPTATCPYCQHDFVPKRIGQIYHEVCGDRVRREELMKKREEKATTLKREREEAAQRMLTERERRERGNVSINS